MRKVVKDLKNIPASLVSQEAIDSLQNIIDTKDNSLIKSDIYNGKYSKADGSKGKYVLEKLDDMYNKKCAYCEERTEIYIEHYRPKGSVQGSRHGGYYWLCYEWSNLLPACYECNKIGESKGTQFPVGNNHLTYDDCLTNNQKIDPVKVNAAYLNSIEAPYLLHPEIDEPKDFWAFEIDANKNGVSMIGIDGIGGRGDKTISICNLNRQPLLLNRLDYINDYVNTKIKKLFAKLSKGSIPKETFREEMKELFQELDSHKTDEKRTFTLLRWFVMESADNFHKLAISSLPKNEQEVALAFFKAYKNGTL